MNLKHHHSFYSQVQTHMLGCNVPKCHLVIWTLVGLLIKDVDYNQTFADEMLQKSKIFVQENPINEIVNKLLDGQLEDVPELTEFYCLCQRPPFGRMLKCSGDNCEKWYHMECLGKVRKPSGHWICDLCVV